MIINNRLRNAYLLYGMYGSGKTSLARVFANAVNCQHPNPYVRPCGQCEYCLKNNIDIVEIDAASNTSIDDVRNLRERIMYLPELGQKRIYIIDEIHRFSGSAFDALLKMIEEPPAHIMFLLATTDLGKVPQTIQSRCVLIQFQPASIEDIEEHLHNIANAEGIAIDQQGLHILAIEAKGSLRDAVKLLDQMVIDPSLRIRTSDIQLFTGMINRDLVKDIVKSIISGSPKRVIESTGRACDDGAIPSKLADQIVEASHSKLIYSINSESKYEYAILSEIASKFSDLIRASLRGIERIDIEILSLKLASRPISLDTFISQWNNGDIQEAFGKYTRFAGDILKSCTPISYQDKILTIKFYDERLSLSMQAGNKMEALESSISEVNGILVKVKIQN
jgi:DNA polymerase III subunit gamma/tau